MIKRFFSVALLALAAVATASPDPVADTRQIMAGTVTTKSVKQAYLSGARDSTAAFQGALSAYKGVRAAEGPAPAPAPVPAPAVAYDASIGTGVTADGFAILPLRASAHRYFVNAAIGSDARSCDQATNPATPLASIPAGVECVAVSYQPGGNLGDQVLIAEGLKYDKPIPWVGFKSGYSAQYPTVIQSYDPADPLNEAKYGRGDQRQARPVITVKQGQIANGTYSFIAIRGIDFNPGNVGVADAGMGMMGQSNFILLENNLFQFTGVTFDVGDKATSTRHILRHNSLYGQWATGGRTGGLYDAGTDGITVEDNVFWHNGWRVGGSRDDPMEKGGTTVFSHPFYLQTNTFNAVLRRNLTMDGAGDGGIARGDILAINNVSIENPACLGLGGGPSYGTERPKGIKIEAAYNVCLGDADTNSGHRLGWGINTANGIQGSRVHHNVLARTRDPQGDNVSGFSNGAFFDQPSYALYDHNLLYRWASPPAQTYWQQTGGFVAQNFTTYEANAWGGPPQGTNVNSDAMTFPKAYTVAELFAALGCGSTKEACAAKMVATPEIPWGAKANALLLAGYGIK